MGFFQNIIEQLKKTQLGNIPDPSVFGDPLAMKVSWEPANYGGANFQVRHLAVKDGIAHYQTSGSRKYIVWFLAFLTIVTGTMAVFSLVRNRDLLGFLPLIVPGILWFAFSSARKGYCFNGQNRTIYQVKDGKNIANYSRNDAVPFDRVVALQILVETVSTNNGSFQSYELNLVLDDVSRICVADHSKYDVIVADAEVLAEMIGVPVRNAVLPENQKDAGTAGEYIEQQINDMKNEPISPLKAEAQRRKAQTPSNDRVVVRSEDLVEGSGDDDLFS